MKIIRDNYTAERPKKEIKKYPRKFECDHCHSELEYDESDLKTGALGCKYIECPLCHEDIYIDDEDATTLTVDNIEFPTHFYHFFRKDGIGDYCTNEYVRDCIRRAIKYLRENKDEYAYYTGTGNAMIIVFRMDGDEEYNVIACNGYYNSSIPFEEEDY